MNPTSKFVIMLLLGGASATFLQKRNLAASVSDSMNCGSCISSGGNFCVSGNEHFVGLSTSPPTSHCCAAADTTSCPYMADTSYKCSGSFYDQSLYAYYTCPFYTDLCGTSDVFSFTTAGATANIAVSLTAGNVCFYEVSDSCQAPGIKLASQTGSLTIGYVEVNNATAFESTLAYIAGPSNSADHMAGSPKNKYPPRSQCINTTAYQTYTATNSQSQAATATSSTSASEDTSSSTSNGAFGSGSRRRLDDDSWQASEDGSSTATPADGTFSTSASADDSTTSGTTSGFGDSSSSSSSTNYAASTDFTSSETFMGASPDSSQASASCNTNINWAYMTGKSTTTVGNSYVYHQSDSSKAYGSSDDQHDCGSKTLKMFAVIINNSTATATSTLQAQSFSFVATASPVTMAAVLQASVIAIATTLYSLVA